MYYIFFAQLVLSVILGGLVGWQRERIGKSAGPRTYALVSLGSTLFTILSIHAFGATEPGRVAAQIITGIGFIGAGTILHKKDVVEGLTTAAGIWAVAAVGMAVGVMWLWQAMLATFLMLAILVIDDNKWFRRR